MKKRILGILTAMVLCLTLLPTAALAEGADDYYTDVLIPWNQTLDGDVLDSRGTLTSAAYVADNGIYEIWAGGNVLQLQAYKETDDMSVVHFAFHEVTTTNTTNTEAVRFRFHVVDETHITIQCIGNAAPYYNQTLYILPQYNQPIDGKYLGWNSVSDVFLSDEPVLIELKDKDLKCVSTGRRLFSIGYPKFRKMQETLSVKKVQTFTYDGTVKLPVITGTNNDPQRTSEVNYGLDGVDTWYTKSKATEDAGFRKDVGSYTAYIRVERQRVTNSGVSGQNTFVFGPITVNIVNQAQITRDAAAIAGLTYNGQTQELVSPAKGTGGTVKYSLDGTDWSTDIPTAKDAGTYTVYYKVVGEAFNDGTSTVPISDSETKSVSVTIAKQALKVTSGEVKQNQVKYFTGRKLSPPCMKEGEYGTTSKIIPADAITYGGEYQATTVGTYTATVQPSSNYTWKDRSTDPVSLNWKIISRTINLTGVTAQSRPYEAGNLNVNVEWDGSVKPVNIDDDAQNALNEALRDGKFTITVDPTGVMEDDAVGENKRVRVKATMTGEQEYIDGVQLNYIGGSDHQLWIFDCVDITKPEYTLIAPTAAENLTYNPDDTTPKPLLTTGASCQEAGTVEGITYSYRLGEDGTWNSSIPTASAAGTYDVYYRANETTGYAETVCDTPVQVTIKPYEITPPTDADLAAAAAYNGSEQTAELKESYVHRNKVEFTAGQTQTNAGSHSVTLSLTDSNYTWPNNQTTCTLNWTIAPKPVTAKVTVTTKDYDGTTTATVSAAVTAEDLIGNDTITISGLTGTFADANVGTDIPVTVNAGNKSITGDGSGNYAVTIPESTTGNITSKTIGIDWSNTALTYNGNEQVPTATATGLVSGDTCTITVTGGQTNVDTGYTATAERLNNSNYQLPDEKTTTFSITPKALTVTGLTATDRVYDADNTEVKLTGGTLSGIVSGDEEFVSAVMPTSGAIESANAGDGKTVSFAPITLSGTKAGNYTLTQPKVTVNISKADPAVGTVTKASPATIYTTTPLNSISLDKTGATPGTPKLTAGQALTAGTADYDWTFTPTDSTNYKTVTGTISLTVVDDALTGISIGDTAPSKTEYKYGETFQTDGLTVTATYASGNTSDVTDQVTFGALAVGDTSIVLSYQGKTCTVSGLTVGKADARELSAISVKQKYTITSGEKAIGTAGMPADAGTLTYAKGSASTTGSVAVTDWDVDSTGKVTFTLSGGAVNDTVTLPIKITSTNYADSTVNVVITLTEKDVPTVSANDITVTYTGSAIPASAITGTAIFGTASVDGTWSFKTTTPKNVADSSDSVTVVFTPTDSANYETVEDTIKVTINKATPTGTPTYTAISTSDKTLADAALAVGSITPAGGSITWDLGDSQTVSANTSYKWTYTPTDESNYNKLTGSITPYVVSYSGGGSSSGGGGGSSSSNTTTKNPDGSTTTTTTDKNTGTVTETTKNTDGSTTTVETKKDGTVTETVKTTDGTSGTVTTDKNGNVTEAKATISTIAAKEASKSGKTVTLPVEVSTAKNTGGAPSVEINMPKNIGSIKVEIPVEKVTPGTVAVIVNADGTEKIISTSVVTDYGVALKVDGSTTVKIIDNAKSFTDVPATNVFFNEISSLSARNIMIGVSDEKFNLNGKVTLDQIANVAGRITGAVDVKDFNSGISWGKTNGLKSGSDSATRGDVLKALYIAAGSPAVTDTSILAQFKDSVPEDLKAIAAWAAQNGILKGNIDSNGALTANLDTNVTRGQACALAGRTLNTIG